MIASPIRRLTTGALTLTIAASAALAQGQSREREGRPRGMPKMFRDDSVPNVGDQFPDVVVYTDKGDKFHTSRLKGRYTVLVFGCLT